MEQALKKQAQDNESVGYGRPPVHSRFKKGQSGNPSGRPRRGKHTERAKQIAIQEFYRPLQVRDGNEIRTIPALQAVYRAQLALAAKGNGPAQRSVLRLAEAIEGEEHKLNMEMLKTAIEYRQLALKLERDVELGRVQPDPLMPKPDDILVDMHTGEVAFTHEDFLRSPNLKSRRRS
jgi:Family of unknown function (DUF5681)